MLKNKGEKKLIRNIALKVTTGKALMMQYLKMKNSFPHITQSTHIIIITLRLFYYWC